MATFGEVGIFYSAVSMAQYWNFCRHFLLHFTELDRCSVFIGLVSSLVLCFINFFVVNVIHVI
jgi:hypothetical protein